MRATLYESLTATRKVTLHRKAAQAIETIHESALDDYLPALAHHWARASAPAATRPSPSATPPDQGPGPGAVGPRRGGDVLPSGAESSSRSRGIQLVGNTSNCSSRSASRSEEQVRPPTGGRCWRPRTWPPSGGCQRSSRPRWQIPGATCSTLGDVDHERVAAFEAALDAAGGDDTQPEPASSPPSLRRSRTRWPASGGCSWPTRPSPSPAAPGTPPRSRWCSSTAASPSFFPDTLDELLANTEELLALAERLDDPLIRAQAWWLRGRILAPAGEMEEANRRFEAAEHLTEELGRPTLRWLVGTTATARTILAGDLEEGERRAHAIRAGPGLRPATFAAFLAAHLFLVRLEQDRLGELEEQFAGVVAALRPAHRPGVPGPTPLRARSTPGGRRALRAAGRRALHRSAQGPYLDDGPVAVRRRGRFVGRPGKKPRCSSTCSCRMPARSSSTTADERGRSPLPGRLGGDLGDLDEAERRFGEAAGTHERIGAPTWLARTRVEWARMLLTRAKPGYTEQAHDLLHRALHADRGLTDVQAASNRAHLNAEGVASTPARPNRIGTIPTVYQRR